MDIKKSIVSYNKESLSLIRQFLHTKRNLIWSKPNWDYEWI